MSRRDFPAIPTIPAIKDNPDLSKILTLMKENIELLNGTRGSQINHAVVKGDIELDYPDAPTAVDLDALTALSERLRKLMVALKT